MRGIEQIPWLYDACCALVERFGLGRWRRWLVGGAAGRVLDVGCGTGRNLPLFDTGVRVVGLDPTRDALLAARRRAPAVPLVQGDAQALPFRTGAFDTVVSGLVFCSVPDPDVLSKPESQTRGVSPARSFSKPVSSICCDADGRN